MLNRPKAATRRRASSAPSCSAQTKSITAGGVNADDGGLALYQLHNDGSIFRWKGSQPCDANGCFHWEQLDNNPQAVALAASDLSLFQLHNDGSIFVWQGRNELAAV